MTLLSCGHPRTQHHSSSVVQYLYPDKKDFIEKPATPLLSLPIRVGVAFVPENDGRNQTLTERDKMEFLNDGYESKVTIDAKAIYHNKRIYTQKREAANGYDTMVYPAITQRWILLNGKWFIKSLFRLQYLGSS